MPAQKIKKRKSINLLPQKEIESTLYGRILKWLLTSFRFIVVSVELVVILGFLSRFVLDVQNTDLDDEIATNTAVIESFSSFEKTFRDTQNKLNIFSDYSSGENSISPIMDLVARSMPPGVRLKGIRIEDSQTTIDAESLDEGSILQFVSNLSANADREVGVISTMFNKDTFLVEFKLLLEG